MRDAIRRRLLYFALDRPVLALALTAVVTAAFAAQLPNLRVESDFTKWIPQGDDALGNLEQLEEIFGSTYLVRILVVREDHPDGVYNPETLALVAEITDWLRSRAELDTDSSADLRSLATVDEIKGTDEGLVVEPFMEEPPATREEALAIRARVERDGIYHGLVAGYDGKAAAIVVRESADMRGKSADTYYAVRSYIDELEARGIPEKLHVTGRPVIEGLFDIYIPQEGYRMLPFVLVMLAVFLYASFRSVRGVALPLLVTAATEVWMFGGLALWGRPMYSITSILSILIVSIAVADSIHLLATYDEVQGAHPHAERRFVLERTLDAMLVPVFLTSLTTVVGFVSMVSSSIVPIADFGVIAAGGVSAAFVLTLLVVPSILALLPLRRRPMRAEAARAGLDRFLAAPTRFCDRNPAIVVGGFTLLLAVSAVGMLRLTSDSSQVRQFPPGHHLRAADDADNRHFAGSTTVNVLVDGGHAGAMKSPDLLGRIDVMQRRLEEMELVRDTFSIAELVKRMNRVMNEDRPAEERIPDTNELIAQYLLLYSMSGDPGDFDDLIDYDDRYANVMAFVRDPGTAAARAVVGRAEQIAREVFGEGPEAAARVKLSGTGHVNAHLETYVTRSQFSTLFVCLPILFVLCAFVFRSWLLGLLSIAPVSLAVASIYGTMGYIALPTDIATTMLGAMTLGIGIDFAIHYLHRYRTCRSGGMTSETAAVETARTAGRALFYNAVVLIGGFIVLVGARLYPQIKLGLLVSVTMVICYWATMLLFPAALALLARRRGAPSLSAETSAPSLPERSGVRRVA